MLNSMFKSVLEQDKMPIVLCDLEHTILYMNPAAVKRYQVFGGKELVGSSLLRCHNERSCEQIKKVVAWFSESQEHNIVHTAKVAKENKDVYMVALRDEKGNLIGYYEKHEKREAETAFPYDFSQSL